jgi:hypothetical protein
VKPGKKPHFVSRALEHLQSKPRRQYDFAVSTDTIADTRATEQKQSLAFHAKTFRVKEEKSEHVVIPDRRFSSKRISVEGVLWSSQRKWRGETVRHTLTSLEVLVEDMTGFGIFSILPYNDARTTDNLASIAIAINFAEARPFTQDLRISDLDERNRMRSAKRFNELDVFSLRTSLDEYAKVGLTPI